MLPPCVSIFVAPCKRLLYQVQQLSSWISRIIFFWCLRSAKPYNPWTRSWPPEMYRNEPISNHGIKQPNHQQYIQYPLSNLYTLSETNQLGDYFPFRKAYAQPGSKTTNGPARMVKGALNVVWRWGSFSVTYLKVLLRMTITWMIRTFSL